MWVSSPGGQYGQPLQQQAPQQAFQQVPHAFPPTAIPQVSSSQVSMGAGSPAVAMQQRSNSLGGNSTGGCSPAVAMQHRSNSLGGASPCAAFNPAAGPPFGGVAPQFLAPQQNARMSGFAPPLPAAGRPVSAWQQAQRPPVVPSRQSSLASEISWGSPKAACPAASPSAPSRATAPAPAEPIADAPSPDKPLPQPPQQLQVSPLGIGIVEEADEDEEEEEEEEDEGNSASEVANKLWNQLGRWTSSLGAASVQAANQAATRTRSWASSLGAEIVDQIERIQVEPGLNLPTGNKSDAHLNSVSIEYPAVDIEEATYNFSKDRELGSGAFGSVYKGKMKDGTEVAIKLLKVPDEAGFEDEVKVLSRFRHPNLVILMGFARHQTGGRSLVYEFLAGGDVTGRLKRSREKKQSFDGKMRLSVALDAASGLSHMHNAQPRAFHRDIKCPNILMDRNGTAKMADFGLACVSQATFRMVGQASGTPGYACPDYLRSGIVTEGSEVHSFGMVILEMLTGIPPAVIRPNKPGELDYLITRLLDTKAKDANEQAFKFQERLQTMLDASANFSDNLDKSLGDMVFRCVVPAPVDRPHFVKLIEELRAISNIGVAQPPAKQMVEATLPEVLLPAPPYPSEPTAVQPLRTVASPPPPSQVQTFGHLVCVSADGVKLENLSEQQYRFPFLACDRELVVGRAGQLGGIWEVLVLEDRCRATISREHFKIVREDGDFFLSCLSPNGLILNEVFVQNGAARCQLHHEDQISLVAVGKLANSSRPTRTRFITFSFHVDATAQVDSLGLQIHPASASKPARKSVPLSEQSIASGEYRTNPFTNRHVSRLRCVFSENVDLDQLTESQRCVSLVSGEELTIGRIGRMASLWDALVPQERHRAMISREHLKIVMRGNSWRLLCLSPNGLAVNDEVIRGSPAERQLENGDTIALLEVIEGHSDLGAAPQRRPFVEFTFLCPTSNVAASGVATAVGSGLLSPVASNELHSSIKPRERLCSMPEDDDSKASFEEVPDWSPLSLSLSSASQVGFQIPPQEEGHSDVSPVTGPRGNLLGASLGSEAMPDPSPKPKLLSDVSEDDANIPVGIERSSRSNSSFVNSTGTRRSAGVLKLPVDVELEPETP